MDVTFKLQGFEGLAAALKELPADIAKNALRSSVGAAAAVIRDEAKATVPVDTGTLRRALYIKQIRELSGPQKQVFYVGARKGKKYQKRGKKGLSADAFYAVWIEHGHFTRPPGGRIKNSNRGQRNNEKLANLVQSGAVRWVPAQPFLRPAFDTKKGAATNAMAAKLRERIERFRVQGK